MFPLTKARAVAFARCWGLWRRWLKAERAGLVTNRHKLHWLFEQIRKEMEP